MSDPYCCKWYNAYFFDNPLRRLVQNPDKIVGPYVKEGYTVLDLGCGMGYYSIAMAEMVGPSGRVLCVDLQQEMLDVMKKRAAKKGVAGRIIPCKADKDDIKVEDKADFALAMWMVHEVPDRAGFLAQVRSCLKDGSKFLIAEPKIHVSKSDLADTVKKAEAAGFAVESRPKVGLSNAALLSAI